MNKIASYPKPTRRVRTYVVARRVLSDRKARIGLAILALAVLVSVVSLPAYVVSAGPVLPDVLDRIADALGR